MTGALLRLHEPLLAQVYDRCVARSRTNVDLDDGYIATIMGRYRSKTKTAAVDMALRHLAGQPMSREEALAMRGVCAIGDLPVDAPPPPGP